MNFTCKIFLLYLTNKCAICVNNYLFLMALLHVSVLLHHPHGELILSNNHLYKYSHFINFVTLAYVTRIPLRMMYKHWNMWQCYKKQIIVNTYCAFVG